MLRLFAKLYKGDHPELDLQLLARYAIVPLRVEVTREFRHAIRSPLIQPAFNLSSIEKGSVE